MDREFYVSVELYVSAKAASALRKVRTRPRPCVPPCAIAILASRHSDAGSRLSFLVPSFPPPVPLGGIPTTLIMPLIEPHPHPAPALCTAAHQEGRRTTRRCARRVRQRRRAPEESQRSVAFRAHCSFALAVRVADRTTRPAVQKRRPGSGSHATPQGRASGGLPAASSSRRRKGVS